MPPPHWWLWDYCGKNFTYWLCLPVQRPLSCFDFVILLWFHLPFFVWWKTKLYVSGKQQYYASLAIDPYYKCIFIYYQIKVKLIDFEILLYGILNNGFLNIKLSVFLLKFKDLSETRILFRDILFSTTLGPDNIWSVCLCDGDWLSWFD